MIKKNIIATALILTMCASAAFLASCTATPGMDGNTTTGTGTNKVTETKTEVKTEAPTEVVTKAPVEDTTSLGDIITEAITDIVGGTTKNNHRVVPNGK